MKKMFLAIPKSWLQITGIFIALTLAFYLLVAVLLKGGLNTVYRNWDAPSYVLTALSLYDPGIAYENNILGSPLITRDWSFLPAHFPLYPLLIRTFSFLGLFRASLLISLAFTLFTLIAFYELVRVHKLSRNPLLLTLPLMLLTPRWFALYHVGSTEPIFLFFLIMSLKNFQSGRHWAAASFAAFAQLTRPQGALLGVAYAVIAVFDLFRVHDLKSIIRTYYPYLLIPTALLAVFTFYYFRTGDFFAFFSAIREFDHVSGGIFPTFNFPSANIETFWQEVNAVDYVIYFTAILFLWRQKLSSLAVVALIFFLPLPFIAHTDISRYAIPLLPFAFIAYREIIERPDFVLGSFLMSPAVMLYTINFMSHNHGA